MLDFFKVEVRKKKDSIIISPIFKVVISKDLMIRGGAFYAVWDEEMKFWTTNEYYVQRKIDDELSKIARQYEDLNPIINYMSNFDSNSWNDWRRYCKNLPDNYEELDSKLMFSNDEPRKDNFATKSLDYPLEDCSTPAYTELSTTLYDPEELQKLEWAIGSIVKGDSIHLQKFFVMYGAPGTGKSTMLNVISNLFKGYIATFDSKSLSSSSNAFAMESFKNNPIVAIQHDGDLSKLEDNTRINSIVSHETMIINEKFRKPYEMRIRSLLFMGTNKPVKISDAKSGILRRLIDIYPSGRRLDPERYDYIMGQINFELPGIAWHCLKIYEELGSKYYNKYTPVRMIGSTNDFYNFIIDNLSMFEDAPNDEMPLTTAWMRYKEYAEDAKVPYPLTRRTFKEELKNYYSDFKLRYGDRRSIYIGFLKEKIFYEGNETNDEVIKEKKQTWLKFKNQKSIFDSEYKNAPAQYANDDGTPIKSWDKVVTRLKDLFTNRLHYVRVPENHIVIDFDLKDENGDKSYERNLEAASKFPATYAELSKSGAGIHLHYIYDGDVSKLSRLYNTDIEIKVFNGKSSLRRMLTRCNNLPINVIKSGLPLKEVKPMMEEQTIQSEKHLRKMIEKNLRKEVWPNTRPSMDFIVKLLDDAYKSGMEYDVTDMMPDVQTFALNSTHQADYCLHLIDKMHFKSDEPTPNMVNVNEEAPIVFFDCEVFPNLFIICWKKQGSGNTIVQMINPSPEEVEALFQFRLIGFNNRDYDNHILYARAMGYSNEELYKLSQRIIVDNDKHAKFGQAYNLSYTDVYDYMSSNNKMSLKKWEIKLGIKHEELDAPWDKPLDESRWQIAADYCSNDVFATECVFDATQPDFEAREILAEISGLSINDTTNTHTTKIIVGDDPHPQTKYIYTDLSTIFPGYEYNPYGIDKSRYKEGVKIVRGKSIYKGLDPSEGGFAWGNPGMYVDVALLDIAGMHPHSAITLKIFGEEYTARFEEIVHIRLLIKHKQYDEAKKLLGGKLAKYLDDPKKAKKLSNALKTAVNSVYGLTSANFENKLRDPRNIDNIVAKYGALFMINLKEEVENRGYTVVHIKTDSIKIANADASIIEFVMNYGKDYGYTFEHEATYQKMCIVNDAVYVAKYAEPEIGDDGVAHWWTATGAQFQVPYVFKTLFSHEPVTFRDVCETKSVTTAMYLDFNENLPEGEHDYRFVGKVGLFTPVVDGVGGALLMRQNGEKFDSVGGTKKKNKKGIHRWMESSMITNLDIKNVDDIVDKSYYNALVDEAVDTISKYGDFEWFVSDDGSFMEPVKLNDMEEIPFAV